MNRFLLFVFALALSACGGGGGDAPVAPPDAVTYSVGGQLAGLGAGKTIVLADTSGQSASLAANGSYSLRLPAGTAYSLRVATQPVGQTCSVANGTGTATADVNNISVNCLDDFVPPEAKPVGGTVAGLATGQTLVLQLSANGQSQETTVNPDGSFQFPQPITGTFEITVKTPPTGQACTVANGQGTAGESPAIIVTCASISQMFQLGGSVSGNLGVVALRNSSNGDSVTLSANGAFKFTQSVLQGGSYNVAVFDQSASQTCSVSNGAGTASADVSNITVSCVAVVVVVPPVVVPPPVAPSAPAGLTMTYDIKSFKLAWGTVTAPVGGGTVSYKLFEDPDGVAGAAASTQIGGTLTSATYTQVVTTLLHTRLNAQYRVQACNTAGCSTLTAAISPNITQAIGYFKASNTGTNDFVGYSVALSGDGRTLAVGAPGEGSNATGIDGIQADNSANFSGAVYVFTRTAGVWSQQAYVKASNTGGSDYFGYSVALSSDGRTLAVGAYQEASNATGIGGNQADNSALGAGAVYVFTRTAGVWSQQAYVKASNTGGSDYFGYSVALSSDASTLAVGAVFEDSNATGIDGNQADNSAGTSGAVYVFTRTAGVWSQQAYVKASITGGSDLFGTSVGLSSDGSTLAVGALYEASNATGIDGNQADNSAPSAGAVYVFTRTAGVWSQQAYVKASNTGANDYFGYSVALSSDGSTLAVGAVFEDSNATGIDGIQGDNSASNAGAVYVFTRTAGVWSQQAYVKASNTGGSDNFGISVALSSDGSTLAVGTQGEDSNATGIGGNQGDNSAGGSGAVYVFTRTAGVWSQQAYVKASNTGGSDFFGTSVAISADGSTLAVGAHQEGSNATGVGDDQSNNAASQSGAVYVY